MESLNLNTLANSLPPSNLANAEKDLMDKFKAAALSITTLYRSSRRTSKRAYNSGYAAACQDLLLMIQQGVSASDATSEMPGEGMTIGRIMDWVEARLEAVKSREEEEEEDEERDRRGSTAGGGGGGGEGVTGGGGRVRDGASSGTGMGKATTPTPTANRKDTTTNSIPLTPLSPPPVSHQHQHQPSLPSSPTPSPPLLHRPLQPRPLSITNATAPHTSFSLNSGALSVNPAMNAKLRILSSASGSTVSINPKDISSSSASAAILPSYGNGREHSNDMDVLGSNGLGTGLKRRHETMTSDPPSTSTSSPVNSASIGRRRTRSSIRMSAMSNSSANQNSALDYRQGPGFGDEMDVEEEGRERKRVARR
ncbi:hypothetical protein JAAARDRAFT_42455 [Jaapia argillacea MUCL 33604]|uniref:Uncharacterized protein n=1 Tax=Jaapia argillacea MUCL 33604 TaxID=933084 RepID=A0A067P502_9AGAM|nr:hypothetical protein JAAARDRAFT_42455 [Jaapia argillacea MUCL 33604]